MNFNQAKLHADTGIETSVQNSNTLGNKLSDVRSFFADKIRFILDHKLDFALTISAGALALAIANKGNNDQDIIEEYIDQPQVISQSQLNPNVRVERKSDLLGYVDHNGRTVIQDDIIREQAEKYYLDYDLFSELVVQNESSDELYEYLTEECAENNVDYSCRQLAEILGELKNVEYLISQQYISDKKRIAAQRIINEMLRSKFEEHYLNKNPDRNDKYDLIFDAGLYSYEYVFGSEYSLESMGNVTRKIDNGEYGEEILVNYAQELRDYIQYNVGFDMDKYEAHLDSLHQTDMIAQNNTVNQRGNYE